jgi:hypothetical protein
MAALKDQYRNNQLQIRIGREVSVICGYISQFVGLLAKVGMKIGRIIIYTRGQPELELFELAKKSPFLARVHITYRIPWLEVPMLRDDFEVVTCRLLARRRRLGRIYSISSFCLRSSSLYMLLGFSFGGAWRPASRGLRVGCVIRSNASLFVNLIWMRYLLRFECKMITNHSKL